MNPNPFAAEDQQLIHSALHTLGLRHLREAIGRDLLELYEDAGYIFLEDAFPLLMNAKRHYPEASYREIALLILKELTGLTFKEIERLLDLLAKLRGRTPLRMTQSVLVTLNELPRAPLANDFPPEEVRA
ncbi:MAG: hypothetical protein ACE5OZ_17120 [Candidatus Heimdallarchaeota archaeon]